MNLVISTKALTRAAGSIAETLSIDLGEDNDVGLQFKDGPGDSTEIKLVEIDEDKDVVKNLAIEMPKLTVLPGCCGVKVLHGFGTDGEGGTFAELESTAQKAILKAIVSTFKEDEDVDEDEQFGRIVAVTNDDQHDVAESLEGSGFKSAGDMFQNPKHNSELTMWFADVDE